MNWLADLFSVPSYLQAVILISIICAVGLALGKIKIRGVSLGVTFVFFAGIVAGDLCKRNGIGFNADMITIAQNFGLIVFVYTLGLQVGPGFFTSFKREGIRLNLLGLLVIALTTAFSFALCAVCGVDVFDGIGLLCGAVTNTPMLGTSQQALLEVHPEMVQEANNMATACAVGYPMGVFGVLISTIVLRILFSKDFKTKKNNHEIETYVAEFHVSNPAIYGKTVAQIAALTEKHIIISRIWRDNQVTIPYSDSILHQDDHVLAVLSKADLETFQIIFGEKDDKDWNRPDIDWDTIDGSNLVSKHILVTKPELNGTKIGSLHLHNTLAVNITRINRAGIQLIAYPGFRLQLGDRLTVVGEADAISKVGDILGNEEKVLTQPNLVAIFVGLVLGVILGSIPIMFPGLSTPIKLGIAGGPIVVGILMGAYGHHIHLSTYSTRSANLMLRQMGIVIYLACLGLGAGGEFFSTVFCMQGLLWVGVSFAIALVPTVVCGIVSGRWAGLDYAQNAGMICAAMANPMALTYANSILDDDEASEAYATVYPMSMFIRVIFAQLIILFLA